MQESHAVLVVEFTGPSVSDGTLCTDRLAPSLLALSDALRFLNRLVNPDGVEAGLSVTKAEGGRFELGLWVWRTFENQIACLADGVVDPVPCPAGLLADCLVEILALKKWLEGGTDAAFAFNPAIGGFEVTAGDRRLAVSGGAWIGFRDDECGKPARWVHPLKGPTFYASRLFPFKYEAKGGLAITDGFEVLDTRGTPSRDSSPQASPSEAWGLATTPSGPRAIRSAGPSIPAAGPRPRP